MKNRYPNLTNMLQLIKDMHIKFGINYEGEPRILSDEEKQFRFEGMNEEVIEFKDAQDLEEQLDALVDNAVFTFGTAERMGVLHVFEEAFARVMDCNMQKELGPNNKRGGFSIDLRKPKGWVGPDHSDLVCGRIKGLVVLDGPDASGKTTLAETLADKYDGEVIHLTWNKQLEEQMDVYMMGTLLHAITLSKEKLVIIDRLWMSELVYSEVFRGGTKHENLHWEIRKLLMENDALQVVCLPNPHQWMTNYLEMCEQREEMYGVDERMMDVYHGYRELVTGEAVSNKCHNEIFASHMKNPMRFDCIHYDYTLGRTEINQIQEKLLKLQSINAETI